MVTKIPLGLLQQNSQQAQPKAKGEVKTPQNVPLSNKERIIEYPEPANAWEE